MERVDRHTAPVAKCHINCRSSTIKFPDVRRDVSFIAGAEFCLANTPLHWGLNARLKDMNRTEFERAQIYKAVISAEVLVHISCCNLTRNLCMSEMQTKRSRTRIRHGESQTSTLRASGCDSPVSSSYWRMIPYLIEKLVGVKLR